RGFATLPALEVWYARLDVDELFPRFQSLLDPKRTPSVWKAVMRARAHDSHQAYEKLCTIVDGEPRIAHNPPLIVPLEHHSRADGLRQSWSARRRRPARHAGGERHLPRLESLRVERHHARLRRPPAPRLEGFRRHRRDDCGGHGTLGRDVRLDARSCTCPLG